MKKNLALFGVTLTSMFLATHSVNATDLTSQIETNSSGLGNSITFEKSYNKEKDINNVLVTLLVDENSINTILNQTSGSGSNLSVFYFSLNPKLTGNTFKKNVVWVGDDLKHKTVEEAMATLNSSIAGEDAVTYSEVWPNALTVQYSTDGGKTWIVSDKEGDSTTSIKEDLMSKLSLTDENDLVYGENFRFSMYDEYTQIWGWDALDTNGDSLGKEYVAIDWDIKFPISGKVDDQQVLFISLEDAIKSNSKDITVNENLTVDSDIEVPAGVTLTVADGVTVEIKEGNKFTNNGTVSGDVKIDGVTKTYSNVIIQESKNGEVSVDTTNGASGDTISITTKADKDYKLESIKVINMTSKEVVEVKDGKFVMPDSDVEVIAVFKKVAVDNPKTSDNILLYFISIIVSFVAIVFNLKHLKKINN